MYINIYLPVGEDIVHDGTVHVFERRAVVVLQCEGVFRLNQIHVIHARVSHIMSESRCRGRVSVNVRYMGVLVRA